MLSCPVLTLPKHVHSTLYYIMSTKCIIPMTEQLYRWLGNSVASIIILIMLTIYCMLYCSTADKFCNNLLLINSYFKPWPFHLGFKIQERGLNHCGSVHLLYTVILKSNKNTPNVKFRRFILKCNTEMWTSNKRWALIETIWHNKAKWA